MPASRRAHRVLATATGLAAAVTGLSTAVSAPAQANQNGDDLVISEVYGGGGNTGAIYTHDFVELYNPTDEPISLASMSLQYRAAANTGTPTGIASLAQAGSVQPGDYFVVRLASQANVGVPVPNVDFVGSNVNLSGSSGQVYLARSTTGIDPDGAGNATITHPGVVDFVGFGTATIKEGASAAPSPAGNATSISRDEDNTDTDVNGHDFAVSNPPTPGAGVKPEDPDPTPATIAEIQGTGETTPLLGELVVTEGVVTAAYPRGGLFGFYIQTTGTGGPLDLGSHTASDGVFVYYPSGAGNVTVQPGDHVRVTGRAGEHAGQTQITSSAADTVVLGTAAETVAPTTSEWPDAEAEKESLEGMLFQPAAEFVVTDTYDLNTFGQVGLAVGDKPLLQPTQVADAQDAAAIAAVRADNAARGIILDDGSSTNFSNGNRDNGYTPTNGHLTPAYLSQEAPVRVGAQATFHAPVIFAEGGSSSSPAYRFMPTELVVGPQNLASPVTFENTRTAAPDEELLSVAGTPDIKVASFNVLNYFTTLGDADNDNVGDGGCLAYNDADADGNNVRIGCAQRGAWDPQDFQRQQEKIVAAINALDADIIGLMEIENSAVLGEEPGEATKSLVAALNAAAGGEVWAANPSSAELPPTAEMDVINNAIIYKVDSVERVGEARALGTLSSKGEAFDLAREPIAQAFQPVVGGEPILVVVNHFKSKGSGVDDGTGQGNANPDRIAQAEALAEWVPTVQADLGIDATLLIGDFNSYAMEDPLQVLYEQGYTNVEVASGIHEYSYSFDGLLGSLDHVLANDAALELYTGIDVWNINSGESIGLEYSRWNHHSTDFHAPTVYRSSDHDPVIMGLDLVDERAPVTVTAKATPSRVWAAKTRIRVHVSVTSEAGVPTGPVTVTTDEGQAFSGTLNDEGVAHVDLPPFPVAGEESLVVTYAGDETRQDDETGVVVHVDRK